MDVSSTTRLAVGCCLWVVAILLAIAPKQAHAWPAICDQPHKLCVPPTVSEWRYWPDVSRPSGPFSSEGQAISAAVNYMTSVPPNGPGWCTFGHQSTSHDDNPGWGPSPGYYGTIENMHGDYLHFHGSFYSWEGCGRDGDFIIGMRVDRDVFCMGGSTQVIDYDVTPHPAWCLINLEEIAKWRAPCRECMDAKSHLRRGDPVDVTEGNLYLDETDYAGSGSSPLTLTRFYNSYMGDTFDNLPLFVRPFGLGWRANYFQRLAYTAMPDGPTQREVIYAYRPEGFVQLFNSDGVGGWVAIPGDTGDTLISTTTGFELHTANDTIETYDTLGRLTAIRVRGQPVQSLAYTGNSQLPDHVTDGFGHTLTFAYATVSGQPQVSTATNPAGGVTTYHYDSLARLTSVDYPDGTSRSYGYDTPARMTSLTDEAGVVYATWSYEYYGKVASVQQAGGANHYSFSYPSGGSGRVVTDPLGTTRVYGTTTQLGLALLTTAESTCGGCNEDAFRSYDAVGNVSVSKDFNDVETHYAFNSRNLQTSRTEAYGTAKARTISTSWNASFRLPDSITEPNRTTSFTYDTPGNALTRTITDTSVTPNVSRTWTYTYDSSNRVLTEDGPRTDVADVTSYTYYTCSTGYQCGEVHTVTNALSQTTTYNTYNVHGQPLTITDPNGVVTTLTYDSRQRLIGRQNGSETITFIYWPTGLLKRVTLADGTYLVYTYDGAHRLTRIDDGEGNRVEYTLDAASNRITTNTYDPSNALARTSNSAFNSLNQLWKTIGAAGTTAVTTSYGYDNQGNLSSVNAPLSRNTAKLYDELNRLKEVTDAASGVTSFIYDANDNLTSVADPKGYATTYSYDGFGELIQQVSPDTGTTDNTYDSAGNLSTRKDARNKTGTLSYDALNRVTSITYPDLTTTLTYDAGSNGAGRLTGASDANHSMTFAYDAQGRVTSKSQTIGSISKVISYSYTDGRLTSMTTPSGQSISYGYTQGRVTSVTLNGGSTILHNVLYEPFGPTSGWQWGNGTYAVRLYDADGNPSGVDSAGAYAYEVDSAFRITAFTDLVDGGKSWAYGYDPLDRLNLALRTGQTIGYSYDANGNRTAQTGSTLASFTTSSTSNRLSGVSGAISRSYTYDAAGSPTSDGSLTLTYSDAGRMNSVTLGGVTTLYVYNALGQRVRKTTGSTSQYSVYDESGHLIGEYDSTGALIAETVWMGDIPVATLRPSGISGVTAHYIHTDYMNVPRRVSRPSDNAVIWRWDTEPFGRSAPQEDPDGDASLFILNLRFPGQYFDAESGLSYNYFRDYDPETGRYVESDPIGMRGGVNTYAYVGSDPLNGLDPYGLWKVYGNWCGPDWTGGFKDSWMGLTADQRRNVKPPIDQLDGACVDHDLCYLRCGMTAPCVANDRSACFRQCDYKLTAAAYRIGGFWGTIIAKAIDRPGTRDPGPNCADCPRPAVVRPHR